MIYHSEILYFPYKLHFEHLILIVSFVTYFYEVNKDTQYSGLKKTLNNVYFQKVITKIIIIINKINHKICESDFIFLLNLSDIIFQID